MFRRVLVANRGEIAVRVIRDLPRAGHRDGRGVLGRRCRRRRTSRLPTAPCASARPPPRESYLDIDAIIDAARAQRRRGGASRATASSPRTPRSPRACVDAGLVFVGPPAGAIARMGSKIEARAADAGAGVPVVPGRGADGSDRRRRCSPPPSASATRCS